MRTEEEDRAAARPDPTWAGLPLEGVLLSLILFLSLAGNTVILPVLPAIRQEMGLDYTAIATIVSAYGLGRVILDIPAGFLVDRVSRHGMLVVGLALVVGASLYGAVAPSHFDLLVTRFLLGAASAVVNTAILASMSEVPSGGKRTTVLSLYQNAFNTAQTLFPMVGGLLGTWFHWRSVFWSGAVLGVLTIPLVRWAVRPAVGRPSGAAAAPAGGARLMSYVPAMAAVYFVIFTGFTNRSGVRNLVLPAYGGDHLGLDPLAIATSLMVVALVSIGAAYGGARLADRFGNRAVVVPALALAALADLSLLLATDHLTLMLVAVGLGFSDLVGGSLTAMLLDVAPARLRGLALGLYRLTVDSAIMLGPVLLGALLDAGGYPLPLVVAGVVALIGSAATFTFVRGRRVA